MFKKILHIAAFFALSFCQTQAFATGTSTINPTVPAEGSQRTSAQIRNQFLAAYNDINNLYSLVGGFSTGGIVNVANGGTGIASPTIHSIMIGEGTSPFAMLTGSAGTILQFNGSTDPTAVSTLSSTVQGNITSVGNVTSGNWSGAGIAAAFGGTGQTTYATGDILYSSGTNALAKLHVGSNGNVLTLAGGVPTWAAAGGVSSFSGGTTGLTPSSATTGSVVLSGVLGPTNGGSGVNNGISTVTLGGNFVTSGANPLTLTTSGSTNVTLPTSGTLVNTGVATLSSLTSIGTITTGTWNGSVIGTVYGGTGVASPTAHGIIIGEGSSAVASLTGTSGGILQFNGTSADPTVVTTLPSGVQGNITSLGTVTTGTWNASVIAGQYGGTGVANTGKTITLGSNLTTVGANPLTVTTLGTTSVTMPLYGALAPQAMFMGELFPIRNPSALPTVSYSASTIASPQALFGVSSSNVINTSNFYYAGFGLTQRANAFPQYNVLESKALTPVNVKFTTSFYHTGSQLDIQLYGDGFGLDVYVDDKWVDHFSQALVTGTAQAGAAATITLASGSSATNGFYNTYSVVITGGTGSGQVRQIASYVGATKVATMASVWSIAPDSTSTYAVTESTKGNFIDGVTGLQKYLNLNWGVVGTRKITIVSEDFYGVNVGQNDTVWPAPPTGSTRLVVIGDSFVNQIGGPINAPPLTQALSQLLGWQIWADGEGGTGWVTPSTNELNMADRAAPPPESYAAIFVGASAGTFTVSVNFAGSNLTTSPIAFNATSTTVQTAIQALTNLPANSVTVASTAASSACGNGLQGSPCFIILHNMTGAVLTWNLSGLTGVTSSSLVNYAGTLAAMVPKDVSGNALPFDVLLPGSGNDFGASATASQIQTNAVATATAIKTRFPTATVIYTGVLATGTQGSGGLITTADVAFNTAIKTGAQSLPTINGGTPFIDTYAAGVGGFAWIDGASNVSAPTNAKNDILISATVAGHPTGQGHQYLAARLAQQIKFLFGAN